MNLKFLIAALLLTATAYAQNTDSLINLIYKEKTDAARISRIYDVIDQYDNINPVKTIEVQQQLLSLTKKQKNQALEAVVTSELGDLFQRTGSTVQGTRLLLEAVKMAEASGNPQAIGITCQNLALVSPEKFKQLNEKALKYSTLAGDHRFICIELMNLGSYYTQPDHLQLDSALHYAEKGYRLAIAKKQELLLMHFLLLFSQIHEEAGNKDLALEYIRSAEHLPRTQANNRERCRVYAHYTDFYQAAGLRDSAFFYAYKNLDCAQRTFLTYMLQPAYALRLLYTGRNADSALKYTNLFYSVKDSFSSVQAIQKVQAMRFEEDLRQEKLETERHHNLQYAALAIGILVFVMLFFLFSHSVVASPGIIKFLGILSLLIVFEFINLLIHPYLGDLTHHSPVMMLGFMVFLAALLIPLHHKLEHWIIHKLVEKNNRIRLSNAKKIVERSEKKEDTTT